MTTITPTQQVAIKATVERMQLARGLGNTENACSIAAINLALSGKLTDEIPDCMSHVIGRWIIVIQDRMPDAMRNSPEWKWLLPLAAGTGRDHEPERLAMIRSWMWASLELAQPAADAHGFGPEWAEMCSKRTAAAADAAADAAITTARTIAAAIAARHAAFAISNASYLAAEAAAQAANAGIAAAIAAARTARITTAHSTAAARTAAEAAAQAVNARTADATAAARTAAATDSWHAINPPALLERLINVSAGFA